METGYKVSEIMVRDVHHVDPDCSLLECARKMSDNKVGCLVVNEDGKVSGIITEQDLARKVLAREVDAKKTLVRDIMSTNVRTASPEDDIGEAMRLMGNNEIKHLPVVLDRKLVGLVTSKDIIQIQPGLIDLLSFKSSYKEKN